jgi:hypothetical protein
MSVGPRVHHAARRRAVSVSLRLLCSPPLLAVCALLALAACSGDKTDATGQNDAPANGQTQAQDHAGVQWSTLTFEEALVAAGKQNKMLLVDVWSASCHQCGVMDEEVWNTPDGIRLVGDAIAIKIPSDVPESYSFRHRYPITGLPAVLLLDSNGSEINRVVGYQSKATWMVDASEMMTGVDPIPELESRRQANPEDLAVHVTLVEKYLERARENEARMLMETVLEKDPDSAQGQAEKAVRAMARYYAFFRMDAAGAADYWRTFVERFPNASGVSSALKSTLDQANATGQTAAWIEWVCRQAKSRENNGAFNSMIAMFAYRSNLKGDCLAEAAERAAVVGGGAAGVDTVAVHLRN